MARPLRRNEEEGWYHVFHRGTQRGVIFQEKRDREHFLELLEEAQKRFRLRIHAYVLMDTHYHALIQTPDGNLSQAMQWVHVSYAAWYNAKYHRLGPFWQGRFRSVPVEGGDWAYELSLYLHLNPVRTKAQGLDKTSRKEASLGWKEPTAEEVTKRLEKLREYEWSSYRAYAGYCAAPGWLATREIWERAGGKAEERIRRYREEAKDRLRYGVEESKKERLLDGLAIGSEKFRQRVKRGWKTGDGREVSGKKELRRRIGFSEIVAVVEKVKRDQWAQIRVERGNAGKPLVMQLARNYAGLTLREIGEKVGGMDYAAVSVMLKRYAARMKADPALGKEYQVAEKWLKVET